MSNTESIDVSKITNPSEITRDVIKKLSIDDAIYLRLKFGDQLKSSALLNDLLENFTMNDKKRLMLFVNKAKAKK